MANQKQSRAQRDPQDILLEATVTGAVVFYLLGVFLVLKDDPAQKVYMTIFLGVSLGAVGAIIARAAVAGWLRKKNGLR